MKNDSKKAKQRYVDQPGQWKNTTSEATKKKQAKAWKELEASMKKKK